MTQLDTLVRDTCSNLLKVSHLKSLCSARGFPVPRGGKDDLAAFVASRFLGPVGVEGAMAALDEKWVRVLHAVALAQDNPTLESLAPVLRPGEVTYYLNFRTVFVEVADGLLSRGVAVVQEKGLHSERYRNLRLVLPGPFRPFLPPFPLPTRPLADPGAAGSALPLLRRALLGATGPADSLAQRLSDRLGPKEGHLNTGGGLADLLKTAQGLWTEGPAWRGAAHHILGHLPGGRGATLPALLGALARLGHKADEQDVACFCREGVEAGLLVADPEFTCFRTAGRALEGDGPLAFTAGERGIDVDLRKTGLGPLLELAPLCTVAPTRKGLLLAPDLARLGRAVPDLDRMDVLATVQKRSVSFRRAVDHVRSRHGGLLLHEGLALARVDDAGLRALLARQLQDRVRSLGGPWLAVLPSAVPEMEKLVRKQGLATRRVSA